MKRYSFYIFLMILCTGNFASAQYDTRVQLQAGSISSPVYGGYENFQLRWTNATASVQTKLYKAIAIKMSFSSWINSAGGDNLGHLGVRHNDLGPIQSWEKGLITERHNYRMIDLALCYSHRIKKHELYAEFGATIAKGIDGVLISTYNHPGYPDWLINSEAVRTHHWGLLYNIGYNYILLKNRINIGTSLNGRRYSSRFRHHTLSINVGYNFNVRHHDRTTTEKIR